MTDAAWTAIPGIISALGVLYVALKGAKKDVQDRVEGKVDNNSARLDENTVITTQTRDMADGRLTAVTKQLEDSQGNVERLVNEGVNRASQDLLAKANAASAEMLSKAQVTAADLLAQAKKDAAELLANADQASNRRYRGRER